MRDRNQYVQNAVHTVQPLVIGLESMFSLGMGFECQTKTCTVKFTGELQSAQVSTPSQLSHNEMLKPSPRDMQPFCSWTEMDILIDMHRRLNTSFGYRMKISWFHYGQRQCCKMEGLLVVLCLLDGIKNEMYAYGYWIASIVLHVSWSNETGQPAWCLVCCIDRYYEKNVNIECSM